MSLHHKLCHTLGGTLDLPHAQTHTVVLPHALAYNQPAAPRRGRRPAAGARAATPDPAPGAVGARRPARRAPRSLARARHGPRPTSRASSTLAVANPYANPRPVTRDGVEPLLRAAWAGEPPHPIPNQ